MSRGFGARAGLLVALALLLIASFAPLAAADHSFSHRYLIYGRVVDANHNPVQNVTVSVGYDDVFAGNLEGPCANQPDTETEAYGVTKTVPVTNQYGEFMFCFHHHGLSRGLPGKITLRIDEENNYSRTFDVDPYFRITQTTEQLDHVSAHANPDALNSSYVIQGRIWRPAGKTVYVEGNPVFGNTVNNEAVNITFTHDGKTETFSTRTNNYGDFAYRVNVTQMPTSGTVAIQSVGETHTFNVDPASPGVLSVEINAASPADPFLRGMLIAGGVVVGLAVIGGGGWYGFKKMSSRREEQAMRDRATRKRANK